MANWDHEWYDPTALKKVGRMVRKLEPAPNRRVLDKYGALNKARSAMLMQMRIGHANLNGFLIIIDVIPEVESQCPCGYGIEIRDHVLSHWGLGDRALGGR